ncbi:MAG: sugar ABC transporter permease [Nitrososphaerota archaeon]|nr:sugar ABC transporter permease [Nitrososphaerota archaeon]
MGIPRLAHFLFLLPFFAFFTVFIIVPVFYTFGLSLFNAPPAAQSLLTNYVGGAQYVRAVSDGTLWQGYESMLYLTLLWLPIMLVLSFLIALFLDSRRGKLGALGKIIVFLPYGVPTVIGTLMWGYMYTAGGPVYSLLSAFRLSPNLLAPGAVIYAMLNIIVWEWVGYNVVILLAGLNAIPSPLYDAARMDGASPWQVVRHVKLPMLKKYFIFISMLTIIGDQLLFNEPFTLSNLSSVPFGFTPNLYIFHVTYFLDEFNYAAAIAFVLIGISFVVAAVGVRYFWTES